VRDWKAQNPGVDLTPDVARGLLEKVPSDSEIIADRVINLLRGGKLIGDDVKTTAAAHNLLLNDVYLGRLIKGAS
jgi:hypothetical protein